MRQSWVQKRKRNKIVAAIAVVAVAVAVAVIVTVTASKYKKIGQGKEARQLREPIETRTDWMMMNSTDKQRKKNRI
ncbi:MAG: hypothetical protein EZS28_025164 [Streblomastix strix]|uniref:Uncharacterized protein n=1 Tax=Streblomastix strix TaxID=222440 RepID=A0A5J4V9S5_9EUKA|nr:MAG: hypothetical protein EZS28_025164 [Streblomastix strix]